MASYPLVLNLKPPYGPLSSGIKPQAAIWPDILLYRGSAEWKFNSWPVQCSVRAIPWLHICFVMAAYILSLFMDAISCVSYQSCHNMTAISCTSYRDCNILCVISWLPYGLLAPSLTYGLLVTMNRPLQIFHYPTPPQHIFCYLIPPLHIVIFALHWSEGYIIYHRIREGYN